MGCAFYVCGVEKPVRLEWYGSHRGPPGGWFWKGEGPLVVARLVEVQCQCGHVTERPLDGGMCPGCWEDYGPKARGQYEAAAWWASAVRWLRAQNVEHVWLTTEYIDEAARDYTPPRWWTETRWEDHDWPDNDWPAGEVE